ncbi:hypothetical protein [Coleofasciculus sp. FACHB-501]|uniref:hypothetical protein n=1 Tax=Cyanophyceae TaxID=3028117 RepID=UPI001682D007|nr:hypothetical protein [Coleofasciculus sp. FACHB-501]MBD1839890.1 hypothetical protein [Coleofasciculus sp. FACHB-501]
MMINIVTAIENAHVDILRAVITKSSKFYAQSYQYIQSKHLRLLDSCHPFMRLMRKWHAAH